MKVGFKSAFLFFPFFSIVSRFFLSDCLFSDSERSQLYESVCFINGRDLKTSSITTVLATLSSHI